jgi:hypothetical protein
MKNMLLTFATTAALLVGGLMFPSQAEAQRGGLYFSYGARPNYYRSYRPYYGYSRYYGYPRYGYSRYYGYPRYYGYGYPRYYGYYGYPRSYYGYPYGYGYGYPYYSSGARAGFYFRF